MMTGVACRMIHPVRQGGLGLQIVRSLVRETVSSS